MMKLDEKVILITGACGLIAGELIQALNRKNANLLLVDSDEEKLVALHDNLNSSRAYYFPSNLLDVENHDKIINFAKSTFGKLDCAIHLAYPRSTAWGTPFGKLTQTFLNEDLKNQLALPILLSQSILNFFEKQKFGNLIHVSSIQGVSSPKFEHYSGTNMVSPIEYTAVKTALISITKYLAKLYKGKNIRINCISPGGVQGGQPNIFLEKYRSSCCNKGILDPEDLVGAFLFLISDESQFINGQNIIVDDGWSL